MKINYTLFQIRSGFDGDQFSSGGGQVKPATQHDYPTQSIISRYMYTSLVVLPYPCIQIDRLSLLLFRIDYRCTQINILQKLFKCQVITTVIINSHLHSTT